MPAPFPPSIPIEEYYTDQALNALGIPPGPLAQRRRLAMGLAAPAVGANPSMPWRDSGQRAAEVSQAQFPVAESWGGVPARREFSAKPLLQKMRDLTPERKPGASGVPWSGWQPAAMPSGDEGKAVERQQRIDLGLANDEETTRRIAEGAAIIGEAQRMRPISGSTELLAAEADRLGKQDYQRHLTGPQQMTELAIKAAQDRQAMFSADRERLQRRMGELPPTAVPQRTTVMRDGIPQPSYGIPPALAQGLGVAQQSPESSGLELSPNYSKGPTIKSGKPADYTDDEIRRGIDRRDAAVRAQSTAKAAALGKSILTAGGTDKEAWSRANALDRATAGRDVPSVSGSAYGIINKTGWKRDAEGNLLADNARELRHKELEKRRELYITPRAQQEAFNRKLRQGEAVPVQGDMLMIRALMGDKDALAVMTAREQNTAHLTGVRERIAGDKEIAEMGTEKYNNAIEREREGNYFKLLPGFIAAAQERGEETDDPAIMANVSRQTLASMGALAPKSFGATPTLPSVPRTESQQAVRTITTMEKNTQWQAMGLKPGMSYREIKKQFIDRDTPLPDKELKAVLEYIKARMFADPVFAKSVDKTTPTYAGIQSGPTEKRSLERQRESRPVRAPPGPIQPVMGNKILEELRGLFSR